MPAPVVSDDKRTRPLTILFWIGVALAPVAAVMLLVADGNGPMRLAAVLAILAVVLIGLSIALRDGAGHAGADELFDEVEQLRRELRAEIAAVARGGHQAIETAQRAQESVAALRHRLDSGAPAIAATVSSTAPGPGRARVPVPGGYDAAEPRPADQSHQERFDAPADRSRFDASADQSRFDAPADQSRFDAPADQSHQGRFALPAEDDQRDRFAVPADEGHRGRFVVPDAGRPRIRRQREEAEPVRPQPAPRAAAPQPAPRSAAPQPASRPVPPQPGMYGAAPRPGAPEGRAGVPGPDSMPRPVGVVRHTETVHVTTRHTIVDGSGADPAAANLYGGYPGHWSAPQERPWVEPAPEPAERSWAGHADRDTGHADRDNRSWGGYGDRDDRSGAEPGREGSWAEPDAGWDDRAGQVEPSPRGGSHQGDDLDEGNYWSELRTGGRWASVRDDEHGRELRVGERRAAVHADGGGTEVRVEDRWAVRRSEPDPGDRSAAGARGHRPGPGGRSEPEGPLALPAGGVPVPDSWRSPADRHGQQPVPADRHGQQPAPAARPGHQPVRQPAQHPTGHFGRPTVEQYGHQVEAKPDRQGRQQPEPGWPAVPAAPRQDEPESVRRSRRQRAEEERYGYPPQGDAPRAGGARSADRWR